LYPTISQAELNGWQQFFGQARDLRASYRLDELTTLQSAATAVVRAHYRFIEVPGGNIREEFPRLRLTLRRTAEGWRIAGVTELRSSR
jgi:hypothetical protein